MKKVNALSLELFAAVLENAGDKPVFLENYGVFVDSTAAKSLKDIREYLKDLKLSGEELNKTFHKSWKTVKESTRAELAVQQIMHYLSTYGTDFEGDVYIPDEVLDVPKLKLKVSYIKGLSKDELVAKCLDLIASGVALKEETLVKIFDLLKELDYTFTGDEVIRNKEANIMLAMRHGILPKAPEEFVRYLVYLVTDSTSLVKNKALVAAITDSRKDISKDLKNYDLVKLSTIFNRFKVILLAFKKAHKNNAPYINKVSKLSKINHKAIPENALNLATSRKLTAKDNHWLDNATIYALFKALSACYSRKEGQNTFVYRIRNGKSFVSESDVSVNVCAKNYQFILKYLKKRLNGKDKTVFIPENVSYALPTSEKLFVGNIPTGTKFYGKSLAAGIYWENKWGANDLDLSGLGVFGKIGWNSNYYTDDFSLAYSGDITDAQNGAVEYLLAGKKTEIEPTLVMNNVYYGENDAGYKIVVGRGDKISRKYMMNPNKVMAEVKCQSVQKSTVLGMMMSEGDGVKSFTILNFGAGQARVSGDNEVSAMATQALYQQWKDPLSLNTVLKECGFTVVNEKIDEVELFADLSIDSLTKSTFIDLFKLTE
jgi:hypothetical protein